jgi:hypothetical protein
MVRVVFDVLAHGVRRRHGIAMAFFGQVLPGIRHHPVMLRARRGDMALCLLWVLGTPPPLAATLSEALAIFSKAS